MAGKLQAGLGLLLASAAVFHLLLRPASESTAASNDTDRSQWIEIGLVAALLVFFRFFRMVPPGMWGDDAINGLLAFDIIDGEIHSPFELVKHSHSYFHAISNYLIAASFEVFGASLGSLRLPGVLLGCVAGLGVYGIARQLFGPAVAVIAGILIASAPSQIAHAKTLVQIIFGTTLLIIAVYLFVRGTRRQQSKWIVLSAVPLALTIYTYHSAKIAPLIMAPLLLADLRRRGGFKRTALFAGLFLICLAPAIHSYWHQPEALTGRIRAVSALESADNKVGLSKSILPTLGIFHFRQGPVRYHWFGPGHDPALTWIAAAFVLSGMIESLRRLRQPAHQLLLLWFVVGMIPALFSSEAPRAYRAFLATPPLYIWAAMPLAVMWTTAQVGGLRLALRGIVVAALCGTLVYDYNYYFHRAYTFPASRWLLGERIVELARIVRDAGDGWTGYNMTPTFNSDYESLRLLGRMWNLELHDTPSMHAALNLATLPKKGAIFLSAPGSHVAIKALAQTFTDTRLERRWDPEPQMWWGGAFWPFEKEEKRHEPVIAATHVPRKSLEEQRRSPAALPVQVRCYDGEEIREWRELFPFYGFWPDTFTKASTCHWSAGLRVPEKGRRTLHIESKPAVRVMLNGRKFDLRRPLPPGDHAIAFATSKPRKRIVLRVRWKNEHGHWEIIPPAAWLPRSELANRTGANGPHPRPFQRPIAPNKGGKKARP